MSGWSEDPDAKAYLARAHEHLRPMVEESSVTVTLWSGSVDPKIAIELGYMILLNKPIIAVVTPGTKIPPKLMKVVDRVIEGEITDPGFAEKVTAAILEVGE